MLPARPRGTNRVFYAIRIPDHFTAPFEPNPSNREPGIPIYNALFISIYHPQYKKKRIARDPSSGQEFLLFLETSCPAMVLVAG